MRQKSRRTRDTEDRDQGHRAEAKTKLPHFHTAPLVKRRESLIWRDEHKSVRSDSYGDARARVFTRKLSTTTATRTTTAARTRRTSAIDDNNDGGGGAARRSAAITTAAAVARRRRRRKKPDSDTWPDFLSGTQRHSHLRRSPNNVTRRGSNYRATDIR